MAPSKKPQFLVTANNVLDGATVYLREDRQWSRKLDEALLVDAEEQTKDLLAFAGTQEAIVCDAYAMPAKRRDDGTLDPLTARENIRAAGMPTILLRKNDPLSPTAAKQNA
jgi:hypothetical protein